MDETQEAIEYQKGSISIGLSLSFVVTIIVSPFVTLSSLCLFQQQIDEMLAGSLSQEDEDAVLAELEAITQVWLTVFLSFNISLVGY